MKGSEKLIKALNDLLADELTAICQYVVHRAMYADWGYKHLEKHTFKHARDEMKHADALMDRILFLGGKPQLQALNKLHIGTDVPSMLKNDDNAETTAIEHYNDAIKLATDLLDTGTEDVLEKNLKDEEGHLDYLDSRLEMIDQMSLVNFLPTQI